MLAADAADLPPRRLDGLLEARARLDHFRPLGVKVVVRGEVAIDRLQPVQLPTGGVRARRAEHRLGAVGERVGEHALNLRSGGGLAGRHQLHQHGDQTTGHDHEHAVVGRRRMLTEGAQREEIKGDVRDEPRVRPLFSLRRGAAVIENRRGDEDKEAESGLSKWCRQHRPGAKPGARGDPSGRDGAHKAVDAL